MELCRAPKSLSASRLHSQPGCLSGSTDKARLAPFPNARYVSPVTAPLQVAEHVLTPNAVKLIIGNKTDVGAHICGAGDISIKYGGVNYAKEQHTCVWRGI